MCGYCMVTVWLLYGYVVFTVSLLCSQEGLTALIVATTLGQTDIVTTLLEAGANPNIQEGVSQYKQH